MIQILKRNVYHTDFIKLGLTFQNYLLLTPFINGVTNRYYQN